MAVRQQLSSMLFVKKICEAQIKSLKTGDIDTSVLHQVYKPNSVFFVVYKA
jgi:hypothetical protein